MSLLEQAVLDQPLPTIKVQLTKAAMCRDLEQLFGGDLKRWLKAVKHVRAGPKYAELGEVTRSALDDLEAELEKQTEKKEG